MLQSELAHRLGATQGVLGAQIVADALVDLALLALGELDPSEPQRAVALAGTDDLVVQLAAQQDDERTNVEALLAAEVQVDRQLVGGAYDVVLDDDLLEEAVLAHALTAQPTFAVRHQAGEFELGVGDRQNDEGGPDGLAILKRECDHGYFLLTTEVFSRAVKRRCIVLLRD